MRRRRLVFIILLVSFSAIFYFSVSEDKKSVIGVAITDVKEMINNSTAAIFSNQSHEEQSQPASLDQTDFAASSLENLSDDELRDWVKSESQAMDSTNNDTSAKTVYLKNQAQQLQPEQLDLLKEIALDKVLPANHRIFSAYMISLNQGETSLDILFEVAKNEIIDEAPLLPHSEAELKHGQELAIRYMQIDELFQRAKTDTNALDKLRLLALEAETAQVRSYAEKKLKELQVQK